MKLKAMLLLACLLLLAGAGSVTAQDDLQLEGVELQAMADTFQYALENNPAEEASDWVNPDTNRSGAVVPTRTFENAQGQPCREFVTTIIIADQEEQGYGTACRQPDGSWTLLGDDSQPVPDPPRNISRTYFAQPPAAYYAYPTGFFGRYHIYLSFGQVYRSGHLHRGRRHMDGRSFRNRNSFTIRQRVDLGQRFFSRYRLHDELNYRDWDRRNRDRYKKGDKRSNKYPKAWREKRRDGRRDDLPRRERRFD